jgi:hypothetical protein
MSAFTSRHRATLTGRFSETVSFDDALQLVHDCRNLFTLFVGRDTPPISVSICRKDSSSNGSHIAGLFFSGIGLPAKRDLHPNDLILPMRSIPDTGATLADWIDRAPRLRVGANWLIGTARQPGYLDNNFLACTQAAEAIHRALYPDAYYLTTAAYKPIQRSLLAAIPSDIEPGFKQALKSRIQYGNELSFRRRLYDLVGKRPSIPDIPDAERFVNRVTDTRNYLVHNDSAGATKAASGEELLLLSCGLRVVLVIRLLTAIGIPYQTAVLSVTRTRWWTHAAG